MAKLINIEFAKTYVSKENAQRAVNKLLGEGKNDLRYIIVPVEGSEKIRYGVLFIGESAVQAGIHFHFNCVN